MFRCERWVRLGQGRSVSLVYSSESSAVRAQSRGQRVEQCASSEFCVEQEYCSYRADYELGRYIDSFSGFVVFCKRCRSVIERVDLEDLERLVRRSVEA